MKKLLETPGQKISREAAAMWAESVAHSREALEATRREAAGLRFSFDSSPAELMQTANRCATITARALYRVSGLTLYKSMLGAEYYQDRTAEAMAANADRAAVAKLKKEEARERATVQRAIVLDREAGAEARAAAGEMWAEYQHTADIEAAEEKAAKADTSPTYSQNRAQLVQAAAEVLWQYQRDPEAVEVTAEAAAAHGFEAVEDMNPEQLRAVREHLAFCAGCSAARVESTRLAAPDAANRHSTKWTPITPEAAADWAALMGGTGAAFPRSAYRKNTGAADCWETVEYKPPHEDTPGQWYRVRHYRTIAPYTSLEAAQEAAGYSLTDPAYIQLQDREAAGAYLVEVIGRASLTERERAAVRAYVRPDGQAQAAADKARAAYLARRLPKVEQLPEARQAEAIKAAQAAADNQAGAARWRGALIEAGWTDPARVKPEGQAAAVRAIQRAHRAICGKLLQAARPGRGQMIPAAVGRVPDLVAAMAEAAAQAPEAVAVVKWVTNYHRTAAGDWAENAEAVARRIHKAHQTRPEPEAMAEARARFTAACKTAPEAVAGVKGPGAVYVREVADKKNLRPGAICTAGD